MILPEFAFIAANTARSKAYIQLLIKNSLLPARCYLLVESEKDFAAPSNCNMDEVTNGAEKFFDINESVLQSLQKCDIPYEILGTTDINSKEAIRILNDATEQYFIYSGYGGCILKPELFCLGKRWIHIHAGLLPNYRGSTTAYYSILKENMIGATAIFMNEHIDEGCMIAKEAYSCPHPFVNIDYIYEPYIRAKLLVKILKEYSIKGTFACDLQDQSKAETYFVIHPLLKHIAILGLENDWNIDTQIKKDNLNESDTVYK